MLRDLTTILDLLGSLLVVAAAAVFCWSTWGPATGLLAAGAGVLAISLLVDRLWAPRRRKGVRR